MKTQKQIIKEVKDKRPFETYEDFCEKVAAKQVNARVKRALVAAGAFDSLGGRDDMTEQEKVRFQRQFAEDTGMIVDEAKWDDKEGLERVVAKAFKGIQ